MGLANPAPPPRLGALGRTSGWPAIAEEFGLAGALGKRKLAILGIRGEKLDNKNPRGGLSARRMLPLLVIAAVAIAGFFLLRDYLDFETLRSNRENLIEFRNSNFALTSLVFILAYVVIVAFSLPGAAVASLTGGFLFNLFPGALYNIGAATIGASAIFWAARLGMGDFLAAKMDSSTGAVKKIKQGLNENEISFLFLMRLVPAVPFFVANLLPALVGVKFRNFVFTTFFGIIPGGVVYTWVGAGLGEVFARGEDPNFGIIFEWYILGPILGLCALAVLPIAIRWVRGKNG